MVCIVMATVLAAPVLSLSLQLNAINMFSTQKIQGIDMETDNTTSDSFDPSDYALANYVREDIVLGNRGLDSEELLFGSVSEDSEEAKITAPPDMTFFEDNMKVYSNADGINMREYASLDAPVLRKVFLAEEFTRTGINPSWVRVVDKNGVTGFISLEFITDKKPTPIPTPTPKPKPKTTVASSSPAVANTLGESIAQEVLKYLGIRYRGGAADPIKGFDCSGLTWYVFNRYGISTPRGTDSYYNAGIVISYSQIAPGDVIAWDTSKYDGRTTITHVSLYIGNGMMVHASSSHNAVVKESVSQYIAYGCKMISVHRFIKS